MLVTSSSQVNFHLNPGLFSFKKHSLSTRQAACLRSLKYFNPLYMSLANPQPIFTTWGSSPFETRKSVIQARFLTSRAMIESLTRYWDKSNPEVYCLLCKHINPVEGNLEHLLLPGRCPLLADARQFMFSFINSFLVARPQLLPLFMDFWADDHTAVQSLLNCSVLRCVIRAQQNQTDILDDLFYITRTYVYKIYLTRRKLLTL